MQSGRVAQVAGQTRVRFLPYPGKPTKILNEREFQDCFYFSNDTSVQLVEGGVVTIENAEDNAMYFTKEQFNSGLHFPLPSIFKQFLHYTKIPPVFLHPNVESMSSNRLLMEPRGAAFNESPPIHGIGWWGASLCKMGEFEGLGYALGAAVVCSLFLLGA